LDSREAERAGRERQREAERPVGQQTFKYQLSGKFSDEDVEKVVGSAMFEQIQN